MDQGRPKEEWSSRQLYVRYAEMWQESVAAVQEQIEDPITAEQLEDRQRRHHVGMQAGLMRKLAWEMASIADEWARRDGETRWT